MTFPSKLRAEYAELANQYLDHIPVEQPEDFEAIKEALKAITEPQQNHHVHASLADRVTAIKEIIEEPEMYVEKEKDHKEFKSIIVQRVAAKIQEIDALSPAEKLKYIADQKDMKEKAAVDRKVMAEHKAPEQGSEAHTITHEQWLSNEQLRLLQQDMDRIIGRLVQEMPEFAVRHLQLSTIMYFDERPILDAARQRMAEISTAIRGLSPIEQFQYLNRFEDNLSQGPRGSEAHVIYCVKMFMDRVRGEIRSLIELHRRFSGVDLYAEGPAGGDNDQDLPGLEPASDDEAFDEEEWLRHGEQVRLQQRGNIDLYDEAHVVLDPRTAYTNPQNRAGRDELPEVVPVEPREGDTEMEVETETQVEREVEIQPQMEVDRFGEWLNNVQLRLQRQGRNNQLLALNEAIERGATKEELVDIVRRFGQNGSSE